MRYFFFLGFGVLVQWVSGPTFIGICGVSDNPGLCILIRAGIVFAVFLVLSAIVGKSK